MIKQSRRGILPFSSISLVNCISAFCLLKCSWKSSIPPLCTPVNVLVMSRTKTNRRTDREQYTRSNAATARLLTLVKRAETLAPDWPNTNERREMVTSTITLLNTIYRRVSVKRGVGVYLFFKECCFGVRVKVRVTVSVNRDNSTDRNAPVTLRVFIANNITT